MIAAYPQLNYETRQWPHYRSCPKKKKKKNESLTH